MDDNFINRLREMSSDDLVIELREARHRTVEFIGFQKQLLIEVNKKARNTSLGVLTLPQLEAPKEELEVSVVKVETKVEAERELELIPKVMDEDLQALISEAKSKHVVISEVVEVGELQLQNSGKAAETSFDMEEANTYIQVSLVSEDQRRKMDQRRVELSE